MPTPPPPVNPFAKRKKPLQLTFAQGSPSQLEVRIMATIASDFCVHNKDAFYCWNCVLNQIWVVF